eukprot:1866929-Karenia_brevis.AAC.1
MDSAQTSPATGQEESNNEVPGSSTGNEKTMVGKTTLPKPRPLNIKKDSNLEVEIKNLNALNLDATASLKFHAKALGTDADIVQEMIPKPTRMDVNGLLMPRSAPLL